MIGFNVIGGKMNYFYSDLSQIQNKLLMQEHTLNYKTNKISLVDG